MKRVFFPTQHLDLKVRVGLCILVSSMDSTTGP